MKLNLQENCFESDRNIKNMFFNEISWFYNLHISNDQITVFEGVLIGQEMICFQSFALQSALWHGIEFKSRFPAQGCSRVQIDAAVSTTTACMSSRLSLGIMESSTPTFLPSHTVTVTKGEPQNAYEPLGICWDQELTSSRETAENRNCYLPLTRPHNTPASIKSG